MRRINFNENWEFALETDLPAYNKFGLLKYAESIGASSMYYDNSNWEQIDLPHDWAIKLPRNIWGNTQHGGYPNSMWHHRATHGYCNDIEAYNIGWYRKNFKLGDEYENKRIFIEFEGVFRDAIVWVNGVYIDRHNSGYTTFCYEIADHLVIGGENSVAVRVDSDQHEGWWYEGSGIYRNVFLLISEPVYFKYNQTTIKTTNDGIVCVSACLVNDTALEISDQVKWCILDMDGKEVAREQGTFRIPAYNEIVLSAQLKVATPQLWRIENPYLYTLQIHAVDTTEERFGIRTAVFDADRGFLLNGEPVKIRGACCHQDFGGVGVALTDNLHRYRVEKLKEMGVNAYRSVHHAPAPALLRACDELGMLVLDETRTFGTSPEAIRQLRDLMERDRNHPCVILWCVGNEEFSVDSIPWGYRLQEKVTRLAKEWDDTRQISYAGCNGSNDVGANGAAEVRGVNYIRNGEDGNWIKRYHEKHPNQPIVGTEESSYLCSRGGDKNDFGAGLISCVGDVTTPWASTPKGWVKYAELLPCFAGSFMWTGFDYRGEPYPFKHVNVITSFGTIDLCGMPKPPFYYYKAWWREEPIVKLAPHWNFNEGEEAWVIVYTNCPEVELFLNNRSIGKYTVKRFDTLTVKLPFEPGAIRAVGTFDGNTYTDELRTASEAVSVAQETILYGESPADVSIVELKALDHNGNLCPLADDVVELELDEGRIVGVGNGDPASYDYEQKADEEVCRYIRSFDSDDGLYFVPQRQGNELIFECYSPRYEENIAGFYDDYRVVLGNCEDSCRAAEVKSAKKNYVTRISSVEDFQYLEFEQFGLDADVYLNGEKIGTNIRKMRHADSRFTRPYRFYCNFAEGVNEIRVEVEAVNDVNPFTGYVKVGKRVKTTWQVRFHYGLARVFVKSDAPDTLKVKLKK